MRALWLVRKTTWNKNIQKTLHGTSTKTNSVVKYPCDQYRKQNSITCYLRKEAVTQRGSKFLRSWYPKHIKNSYNSIVKNPNNLAKRMGRRLEQTFFQKDAQRAHLWHDHQKSANQKPQWHITSPPSEWPLSKRQEVTSVSKDVEKRELL